MRSLVITFALLVSGMAAGAFAAESLVENGGFENGAEGWKIFVPEESKAQNCRFDVVSETPYGGANCVRLQADDIARFCIGANAIPVAAGDRYRVSAWLRADAAANVRPKAPGFAIRLGLRQGGEDAEGGHLFIIPGGRVTRTTPASSMSPLPQKWTQVEAVIEIPAGVDSMIPALFAWWTQGPIFVDDFTVEKVAADTPVTPLTTNGPGVAAPVAAAAPSNPGPVTSDAELLAALNLDTPGFEPVKEAAHPANGSISWPALQTAYLEYRRTASPGKWRVNPDAQPKASSGANRPTSDPWGDKVLAHHISNGYHFSPNEGFMGEDFNWTFNPVARDSPAYSDEWTYCAVSRTEFWQTLGSAYWQTGDEKYAAGWVAQLQDFAQKNPMHFDPVKGTPSLWRSLDSAIRITNSWPDAYYHFLHSASFTPAANWLFLKLNYEHALLLAHVLEDPARSGNWVTTECAGLFIIGTLFPEFRDAAKWRQLAIDRLTIEMDRMVPPDGFEAELTPTYHFVALEGFRKPIEIARLNHIEIPANFRDKVLAMYRAAVLVMDQSGQTVPTNDSSPVSAALQAEGGLAIGDDPLLAWAASRGRKGQAPPDSTALPYAGFYAMRGGWKRDDMFLFFRAGPTGIGHQHEDMLEVVLRAWNKTLLFDPGTYPYDQSDWRRFSNGTASHNTIIVDGKWQHRGANKPPVNQPTGSPWVTSPLFDYVAGTYDAGYQESVYRPRPFDPQTWRGSPDKSVSHTRRVLFLKPYGALVLDTLDGSGKHTFDAHFHLESPSARLDPATQAAFSQNVAGAQLALYPLETENLTTEVVQGQKDPLLGWMPSEHRPIPTVRYRKVQEAPAIFSTFLYPYRDKPPEFSASPLTVKGEGVWARRLQTAQEQTEIVLAKNGLPAALSFTSAMAGDVTAKAMAIIIRRATGTEACYLGGINLSSYRDPTVELSLATPAALVFEHSEKDLLCFNPGDTDLAVVVQKPFARNVTLPPQAWTLVSADGNAPAKAPMIFRPLDPASSSVAYEDYAKRFPAEKALDDAAPIRIKGAAMTVPEKAVVTVKTGAEGQVLARWDGANTSATAKIDVAQPGWYAVKMRYCSGEKPVRSLLINGKVPFLEAEGFALSSTIGASPSDGWSNLSSDWKEVALGSGSDGDGWKIYLSKGPSTIELRNDGGGLNLDWLEFDPKSR